VTTTNRSNLEYWLGLAVPSLAVAAGVGALEFLRGRLQRRHMFKPTRYPHGTWQPTSVGMDAEDHWFETEDGVALHGWWLPHPRARCTLLYCHGNRGSLGHQVQALRRFSSLRASVFAFDYRGYGRSEGSPSEAGLFIDVRTAYRYLIEVLGTAPSRVVLLGHSLGGAVAIDAAQDLPVRGLVVQSSFTQTRDMARAFYPELPLHLITRNCFRSIEKVGDLSIPKLFVHGDADETVPIELGRQLYDAAAEPKSFLLVPGAHHNDIAPLGGPRYAARLALFLHGCVRTGAAATTA